MRSIAVLVMLVLGAACSATSPRAAPDVSENAAMWQIDDDANIAFPACTGCGAVIEDRGARTCASCGARIHVEPRTIACPECRGAKTCTHCAPGRVCLACAGTHLCSICDGSGAWHGDTCPECKGAKACSACLQGAVGASCERCEETHVCANCNGTGEITLQ